MEPRIAIPTLVKKFDYINTLKVYYFLL